MNSVSKTRAPRQIQMPKLFSIDGKVGNFLGMDLPSKGRGSIRPTKVLEFGLWGSLPLGAAWTERVAPAWSLPTRPLRKPG